MAFCVNASRPAVGLGDGLPRRARPVRPIGNARIVAVSAQSTVVNAPSTSGQESLSARIASPVLQAALVATGALKEAKRRFATAFKAMIGATPSGDIDYEQINASIRKAARDLRIQRTMMLPLAAISASGSSSVFLLFTRAVASFMKLYLLLLFVRVLLSWFPQFNWDAQPWLTLRQLTDPYLNLFRGLVPPLLGQIDLTPLLGFWILQYLAGMMDVGRFDEEW